MLRIVGFFVGSIRIRITGRRPERTLNEFANNALRFTGVRKSSESSIELTIGKRDLTKAEALCIQSMSSLTVLSKKGLPYFLLRFKKRYVLYFTPLLSVLFAFYLSFYIWEIDVSGNETVTDGEILSALENAGVRIGTFGPDIDQEIIRSEVIAEIDRLSWLTVNVYGCRAEVLVRERIERPELICEREPTEVRAGRTGLITNINVYAGKPLVKAGELVMLGQTLITGQMDSISSGIRFVHAMGDITARTWYSLSACMPLEYCTKNYTGESITRKSIVIGNLRINLYLNSAVSMINYDQVTETERIRLGGFHIPVSMITTTYRQYTPVRSSMREEQAEYILKQRLTVMLNERIKGAELTNTLYEVEIQNGVMTVTLNAECLEQIGVLSPLQIFLQPDALPPKNS